MVAIIATNIRVYSLPMGEIHRKGYETLAPHVCQIEHRGQRWTGFSILPHRVLTTGFYPHGQEFDLEFPVDESVSGFLVQDWGEIIELNVPRVKSVGGLYCQSCHPSPGQMLCIIGSILGVPFTMATCIVDKLLMSEYIMTQERLNILDEHSVGSPVFNMQGSLVGILEAYVEETDKMVIRCLSINSQGLLRG